MKYLAFLDTETTSDVEGRLVQIAVVRPHPGIRIAQTYKPAVPITFKAMAVHHITNAMVENKPLFETERQYWQDHLEGQVIVAHNAPFDLAVLAREGIKTGEFIDTLKIARKLWPDWEEHKLQYLRYRLGVEIVTDAAAHDAMADVEVLEIVFDHMVAIAHGTQNAGTTRQEIIETFIRWSKEASILHTVNFGKHKGKTWEQVANESLDYLFWLRREGSDPDVLATCKHWIDKRSSTIAAPSPQAKML